MILDKIVDKTRKRLEEVKAVKPFESVKQEALDAAAAVTAPGSSSFSFENALRTDNIAFICEVKKASPSKGIISEHFPYIEVAREYQSAGASAISVLTEPSFFLGSDRYLTEIKQAVQIPVLRKDFTIDPYQIYEAKLIGADAVLLICAILDTGTIKEYIKLADQLGLSCLVEAHDEKELQSALEAGARVIGVNNRNLNTFEVDISTSARLRELVPRDKVFVSESGIKTPEDISVLKKNGTSAVLIGETLMRSGNIPEELNRLKAGVRL
ncbi:MAG TPA: indole-3-glycerol phosphate synthase TrpC [Ruminiclostridium sp.]|nr:indole-3-glycerol phosphate synthase TrpC [Ruminiclostridium sp.]